MHRYLLNMSYIGTNFRGAQKQIAKALDDPYTIQGQIEMGLKLLRPHNLASAHMSSRTDAGVHAIQSTMHVDLERRNGEPYDPNSITITLNKHFYKTQVPIRILRTYIVPDTFSSRLNAVSRTYIYRLAVVKAERVNMTNYLHHVPIEELNRCLFMCTSEFDVEKCQEATKLFLGFHDFKTFMNKATKQPDKITRRSIDKLDITKVDDRCYNKFSWPYCVNNKYDDYTFFNVTCNSKGFLYKQVRRTVAALIAVAQGKISTRDIKFMLEVPSHNSWDPRLRTVPPYGLYLCEVAYRESDIQTFKASVEK